MKQPIPSRELSNEIFKGTFLSRLKRGFLKYVFVPFGFYGLSMPATYNRMAVFLFTNRNVPKKVCGIIINSMIY